MVQEAVSAVAQVVSEHHTEMDQVKHIANARYQQQQQELEAAKKSVEKLTKDLATAKKAAERFAALPLPCALSMVLSFLQIILSLCQCLTLSVGPDSYALTAICHESFDPIGFTLRAPPLFPHPQTAVNHDALGPWTYSALAAPLSPPQTPVAIGRSDLDVSLVVLGTRFCGSKVAMLCMGSLFLSILFNCGYG